MLLFKVCCFFLVQHVRLDGEPYRSSTEITIALSHNEYTLDWYSVTQFSQRRGALELERSQDTQESILSQRPRFPKITMTHPMEAETSEFQPLTFDIPIEAETSKPQEHTFDIEKLEDIEKRSERQSGLLDLLTTILPSMSVERRQSIARVLATIFAILYVFAMTVAFVFLQEYQSKCVHIRFKDIGDEGLHTIDIISGLITLCGWILAIAFASSVTECLKGAQKYMEFMAAFTFILVATEVLELALFAVFWLIGTAWNALWDSLIVLTGSAEIMSS